MRVKVTELGMYDFDGDISSIIEQLQRLQSQHPDRKLGIDVYMAPVRRSYDPTEYPVFEVYYIE